MTTPTPTPTSDPTAFDISLGRKTDSRSDPFTEVMGGYALHGGQYFEVPYISHIRDNLYQGGCTNGLVLPEKFKYVISLYPWEKYTIPKGRDTKRTEVVMYDSEDGIPENDPGLRGLAEYVNECRAEGPTLVHCQAGLNRSGLVAGMALVLGGLSPSSAIQLLRASRSEQVLCNRTFESYLRNFKP